MYPASQVRSAVFQPPVWVSSVDHLNQFLSILSDSSFLTKFVGLYNLPEGFPFLRIWLLPFVRIPIICFANGRLILSPNDLHFEAAPWHLFGASVANLRADLNFEITSDRIQSVEQYMVDPTNLPVPAIRYFSFRWTRVRSLSTGLTSDFLIGLGGRGPSMKGIRERNEQFFGVIAGLRRN